ncbi:MAG: hypothetical protein QXS81_02010 [Candidatus Micrarchaeaceae archaeon]
MEKEEESTAERVKNSVDSEDAFSEIYGIRDVKESLKSGLEEAAAISKQGYIPIILLTGPSGSGKTEMINGLIRAYKRYTIKNEIFTLDINGEKCPYNENPYNLYRSILPIEQGKTDAIKLMNHKRPEMCKKCEDNLEGIITDDGKLDREKIKLKRIFPRPSMVELGDKLLVPDFVNVIVNSNRSILVISADKSKIEDMNTKVFQVLNNIYDNNFSDSKGNWIPLDCLIIIHSNETFMEISDEVKAELNPLLERIISVKFRRNLSYSEEMKLAESYKQMIKKQVPHFWEYIAKLNVLSRVSYDEIERADKSKLDNIIELLDYYDSPRINELQREMTQSMSDFLNSLLPDYNSYTSDRDRKESRYIKNATRKIIFDSEGGYSSGWTYGISSRAMGGILNFDNYTNKRKDSLLLSDVARYLNRNMEKIGKEVYNILRNYIDSVATTDARFEVEYALLSFYFGDRFKDYTRRISEYADYLISADKNDSFKDAEGYLLEASRYFDVDELGSIINQFKSNKVPLGIVNYKVKFEDLLKFIASTQKEFVKKESKFKNLMGEGDTDIDKSSELYSYITNFLISERGYFDEGAEEALKVYKMGTIFYDQ